MYKIIILIFICLLFYILFVYIEKKQIRDNKLKLQLLNLIIYNPSIPYEKSFYNILSPYLKTIPFIKVYFISYRNQVNEIEIENDILFINGNETMIPGVLNKTISALKYCVEHLDIQFDYFIRSNISTWIDYDKFPFWELVHRKLHYTSSSVLRVLYPSVFYKVGILNIGLLYAQGTNIILSHEATLYLLKHSSELDFNTIDDVAIGKIFSNIYPIVNLSTTQYEQGNILSIIQYEIDNVFTFRYKSDNRYEDVENMKRDIESKYIFKSKQNI